MTFKKLMYIGSERNTADPNLTAKQHYKQRSIQSATSKTSQTNKATSLKHIFSTKKEEILVDVDIVQARQNKPLIVPESLCEAREIAGTVKKHRFGAKKKNDFRFAERHHKVLNMKRRKLTLSTLKSCDIYTKAWRLSIC